MDSPATRPSDEFSRFAALTKTLLGVPKKELDKKVAAFKHRRKKTRKSPK